MSRFSGSFNASLAAASTPAWRRLQRHGSTSTHSRQLASGSLKKMAGRPDILRVKGTLAASNSEASLSQSATPMQKWRSRPPCSANTNTNARQYHRQANMIELKREMICAPQGLVGMLSCVQHTPLVGVHPTTLLRPAEPHCNRHTD